MGPERPWLVWGVAFLLGATLLCSTDHESRSGDSRYYAVQSARLAKRPVAEWIAPTWGPNHYRRAPEAHFRDHPATHFMLGAGLVRLGVPARHALHLVNMLSQIAAIVLLVAIASRFAPRKDAVAYLWAVQLTAISFSHVVRANHEPVLLLAAVTALYGAVRMADDFRWSLLVAAGLSGMFLIKGLVVVIGPVLAGWAFFCCVAEGRRDRLLTGLGLVFVASLSVAAVAGLYEWAYRAATGGTSFFAEYWSLQIQTRSVEYGGKHAYGRLFSLFFYVSRHVAYTLPWIAIASVLWLARRNPAGRDPGVRRINWIFFGCSAAYIAAFSLSARYATRYAYPSYFLLALPVVIEAFRRSVLLTRLQARVNRFGAHRAAAYLWLAILCGQLIAKRL